MSETYDFIVVGNGAVAGACAIQLHRNFPDLKIAIVGPEDRLGSASQAAGFMLNVFGELEQGAIDKPIARQKFEVVKNAKSLWSDWVQYLNDYTGLNALKINFGTYVLSNAHCSGMDDANFDYMASILKKENEPHELVSPSSIAGYCPKETDRALRALYIAEEGSIESAKLIKTFNAFFEKCKKITWVKEHATGIAIEKGNAKRLSTREGTELIAENIVLAAGAYTQKLIEQIPDISRKIPRVFYGTGTALHVSLSQDIPDYAFELPQKVIRSTNRGNACGIHLVPYDKYRCYIGASNLVTAYYEPQPRMAAVHGILDSALTELNRNFFKANFQMILGHRPTTADTYLIAGKTSVPGLWIYSGTKREGVHLSPLLGQSLVNDIKKVPSLVPETFRPERKLILELTRKEGIEKAVSHSISGAYQHGLKMPHTGWESSIEALFRKEAEELHDRVGMKEHGIPPELGNLYRYGHIKVEV